MAWMLLWRAMVASEQLAAGPKKKDMAFYGSPIKTAEFFINTELPLTFGKMEAIQGGCAAAIEISDEGLGGYKERCALDERFACRSFHLMSATLEGRFT